MAVATITVSSVAGDKPISMAIHRGGAVLTTQPIVGDTLTAVPTCAAACDPNLVYSWTVGGTAAGTSANTYVVTKDDQKKVIAVSAPDVLAANRKKRR